MARKKVSAEKKSKSKKKAKEEEATTEESESGKEIEKKRYVSFGGDDSDNEADLVEDSGKENRERDTASETEALPGLTGLCTKGGDSQWPDNKSDGLKNDNLKHSSQGTKIDAGESKNMADEQCTFASEEMITDEIKENNKQTELESETSGVEDEETIPKVSIVKKKERKVDVQSVKKETTKDDKNTDDKAIFFMDKEGEKYLNKSKYEEEDSFGIERDTRDKERKKTKMDRFEKEVKSAVCIGNLNYETRRKTLKKFLASHGFQPVEVIIITDTRGCSKGFGFANFDSEEQARSLCELKETSLDGRDLKLTLTFRRKRKKFDRNINQADKVGEKGTVMETVQRNKLPSRKVRNVLHVSNLPFDIKDIDIMNKFPGCEHVLIYTDQLTKNPEGTAKVWYRTTWEARAAKKKMNGKEMYGRRLLVGYEKRKNFVSSGNLRRKKDSKDRKRHKPNFTNLEEEGDTPVKDPKMIKFGDDSDSE